MQNIAEDDKFIVPSDFPAEELPNISLGELFYNALSQNPNQHEALVEALSGKSISYPDLLKKSQNLAKYLLKQGFGPDTMIGICSENSIEFLIVVLATFFINAILTPLSTYYTVPELQHCLKITQPKIVFCSSQAYRKIHVLNSIYSTLCPTFHMKNLGFSIDNFDKISTDFQIQKIDPNEQIAMVLYSSGTTGGPKGVALTHRNFVSSIYMSQISQVQNAPLTLGTPLPLFHVYGLGTILMSIFFNVKSVIYSKFDQDQFLKSIQTYRINTLVLVPTTVEFLIQSTKVEKYDLKNLQFVKCGGAALYLGSENEFVKRFQPHFKALYLSYGYTESLGTIGQMENVQKPGSIGKLLPFMWAKIRDPTTGKSLPCNNIGELCLKGVTIMKGYYRNKEATKNSFTTDGWYRTGDMAYYDQEGYFFIVDRLKNLIKYKGFQVSPAELENLLLSHKEIEEVAVVGKPDRFAGELPTAFIVKHPNAILSEEDVKKIIQSKVSPHKWLRGGVFFIEKLPKNSLGKILRNDLKRIPSTSRLQSIAAKL